jgi:hypothetical protein
MKDRRIIDLQLHRQKQKSRASLRGFCLMGFNKN